MKTRVAMIGLVLALVTGCAVDEPLDPEVGGESELAIDPMDSQEVDERDELIDDPEALACRAFNTGAWGCHPDWWCDQRCERGDGRHGWTIECIQAGNHVETVCGCCW